LRADQQQKPASRAQERSVLSQSGTNTLKEPDGPYSILFTDQKGTLNSENTYFLPINNEVSVH
jgi:hypothetical protein